MASRGSTADVAGHQRNNLLGDRIILQLRRVGTREAEKDAVERVDDQRRGDLGVMDRRFALMGPQVVARALGESALDIRDALEAANARNLLDEATVEIRIDRLGREHRGHQRSDGITWLQSLHVIECLIQEGGDAVDMALDQCGDQRLLAREVLVERTDAHSSYPRYAIGAGPLVADLD